MLVLSTIGGSGLARCILKPRLFKEPIHMKIVFKNILLHENKDIMKMKKCFYCNYATNNKSNYNKHMKRMHSSALVRNNIVLKDIGHKENIKGTLTSEIKWSELTHFCPLITMVCSVFRNSA